MVGETVGMLCGEVQNNYIFQPHMKWKLRVKIQK
jgi:hypothetical protein